VPILQSAKKKMRMDIRRRTTNLRIRRKYKKAVKELLEKPNAKALSKAYSELDMAAKKNVIHKKKASRLKSRLSKKMIK
jgi:small subunit ribosomal protein S20